ncbi:hypothetical protein L202_03968 [Cryptococcus amylolentus CBS 6039]|uniref:Uncharacterized protein n=1 Tax=Cryptococcus amylolentus CBS 6039 TaxID=1295533 RepID=A0A1E3HPS3_9TREE|nr:hypothetical protein L202_03968 [Cryptococcus amylolentus CBS 6039]ODN78324.1 hypothetical protein L202_03968 [Cryptococcus amylolentus CBS 6039]
MSSQYSAHMWIELSIDSESLEVDRRDQTHVLDCAPLDHVTHVFTASDIQGSLIDASTGQPYRSFVISATDMEPEIALFHETFTTVSKEDDAERKTEAVQRANGMMSDINEILQETESEWYPQVLQSRDVGAFNRQEKQAYERLSALEQYEGVGFVKVPLDTARAVSRIKPDHIGAEEWEIYLREWDAARGSSRQQEEGGGTTLSRRSRFSQKLRTFFRSHG